MARAAPVADTRLTSALALQQAGKLADAAALYEAVLLDSPGSFDALHMLAVVRYQQGSFDAALEGIDRALALQPANAPALLNRRLIVSGLERRPIAEELVRESMRAHRAPEPGTPEREHPSTRVIAFYLPQYHRIPENDAWWGEGFTEWTNVRRAGPVFEGHLQPHEPAELGYYDLSDPGVAEHQATLAREHGVDAFCYYYYWFGGKRLLQAPLDAMLASKRPDFPFCICWANENWTRRWDGLDQEILIGQRYSPEDSLGFIRSLYPFFSDPRYVRVHGRPLLLVYKLSDIPDVQSTVAVWRSAARAEGIGEIYLASVQRHAVDDGTALGMDATVEFPPIGHAAESARDEVRGLSPEFRGAIFEYKSVAAHYLALPKPPFRQFRGVTPMWDNTARRPNDGMIVDASTPDMFRVWLEYALRQTLLRRQADERIVFINAWNEWAEGSHLEPDVRYGRSYLEAVRDARAVERGTRVSRPSLEMIAGELARARQNGHVSVHHFAGAAGDTTDIELMRGSRPARGERGTSVVVPVYNHARFVRRMLESIALQTMPPLEVIVVDDGSKDDSGSIIEAFAQTAPWPVTLVRQPNAGAHIALNRGLMLARGDTIALVNSDDMFAPTRLARLVAALGVDTALAFSDTEFIDDEDQPIDTAYVRQLRERIDAAPRFPSLLYSLVVENIAISTGNFVFRRALLEQVGGFAPLAICLDWDFLLAASYATRIAFVQERLYRYRLHDANAFSGLRLRGRWEGELLLDEFFARVDRHPWLNDATRPAFLAHARSVGLGGYLRGART
ncbi:MAG: glycoside hydrolase family 99-like domain-containing protein [Pseudomonadota bacterium]|nr:glycoside hydrolase family 99-like domain-containing protein [Pseudomonadota bacterium]